MASTGYSVTLNIYVSPNPLDIPHAFVTITALGQPPVTVGYYPVVHAVAAPGVVKNDGAIEIRNGQPVPHPTTWDKTFDVSPGQAQAMLAYAAGRANASWGQSPIRFLGPVSYAGAAC